jgi:hypothetical protein
MVMVSYVQIPVGLEAAYERTLQPMDRFTFSRVRVKDLFMSRSRVKGITIKSQLVELAPVWAAMASGAAGAEYGTCEYGGIEYGTLGGSLQSAWVAAGAASKLSGWKMFVQDTAARRRAGVSGYATPNLLFQAMTGRIQVVAPATGLQIEQAHPATYYVQKKVTGTKSQYSPKAIQEPFWLPLTIGISWHSVLTALAGDARARFLVVVYSSYQGRTIETTLSIPFDMTDAWQSATATLSTVVGIPRYYEAFIEVYNARGDLYFDNVEIIHNGENWARDPQCSNIAQAFTHAFYQVEKHWLATNITDGADFGSHYFVP